MKTKTIHLTYHSPNYRRVDPDRMSDQFRGEEVEYRMAHIHHGLDLNPGMTPKSQYLRTSSTSSYVGGKRYPSLTTCHNLSMIWTIRLSYH